MNWKFFVAAVIVVGGALAPYAPPVALAGGVIIAAVANWRLGSRASSRA